MANSNILFFSEGIVFNIRSKKRLREWINASMELENKKPGSINFIFCDDEYLLEINSKYLKHNTLTDVITFNNSDHPNIITSDIFISVERVRENAKHFQVSFVKELQRVMIHGILHLLGYNDKTTEEKTTMRSKEDYYLTLYTY